MLNDAEDWEFCRSSSTWLGQNHSGRLDVKADNGATHLAVHQTFGGLVTHVTHDSR